MDATVIKEHDVPAELGGRHLDGMVRRIVVTTAIAWSLFQLWYASPLPYSLNFLILSETQARPIHLAFGVFLAFLTYPSLARIHHRYSLFGVFWIVAAILLAVTSFNAFDYGARDWAPFAAMSASSALIAWQCFRPSPRRGVPTVDVILAALAAGSVLYLYVFYRDIASRPGLPTTADLVSAGIGIVILLEATRRTLGPGLMVIALAFLAYSFLGPYLPDLLAHRGASFQRAMSQQWLTSEGVFGIALGVSTSFVFLFVLFGSLLDRAGAGNYFTYLSFAILGHFRGGPAKAAVVSSGLTGIVSGSSIANVVTTGTFTIPLMKRAGYSAVKAGAFEVAASVNGQILPPVMGAAAFLIAEYVGIQYTEVITHAAVPAIATYVALFYLVHIEALKAGLVGITRETLRSPAMRLMRIVAVVAGFVLVGNAVYFGIGWTKDIFGAGATIALAVLLVAVYVGLMAWRARYPDLPVDDEEAELKLPDAFTVARTGLHYLLPIIVLVWCLMVERLSAGLSAFWATMPLIGILLTQEPLTAFFRGEGRIAEHLLHGVQSLRDGLRDGALNMVGVAVATAAAGIIVGTIALTGLGLVMTEIVESLSGGNLLVMLLLTALLCLILGLGLPTTANYIVVATLMAPIIVELSANQGVVIPLIAAHLFVFYFGLMADVTPPVGLAAYAAAAISGASPIATGIQSFRYEIRTAILPFAFVFNTQLILIGIANFFEGVVVIGAAILALLLFVAATQHWFLVRSRIWETAALLLCCFALLRPGFWLDYFQDPWIEQPASALVEAIEQTPVNGELRLRFEGITLEGDDVSKVVQLRLGADGPAAVRMTSSGVTINLDAEPPRVTLVSFTSDARRYGIETGFTVAAVYAANPSRPPNAVVYIPVLLIVGVIYFAQRRRRRDESPGSTPARPIAA